MGKSAMYVIRPVEPLTQPELGVIELAATRVWFADRIVEYKARRIEIEHPSEKTVYYVTITDEDQLGDIEGAPELPVVCAKEHELVGEIGHTYMGAIGALPAGNSKEIGTGGWPNPRLCKVAVD
jgi:hypothetical protein